MSEPFSSILFDLLRSDAFITVNKLLSLSIGVNESIIYAELLSRYAYFEQRELLTDDGYFFNTVEDLYYGTGLTEYEQRPAIKKLKKLGLIDAKVKGLPAKRYFRLEDNHDLLAGYLEKGRQKARKLRFDHSSCKNQEQGIEKIKGNKNNNTGGESRLRLVGEFMGSDEIKLLKPFKTKRGQT